MARFVMANRRAGRPPAAQMAARTALAEGWRWLSSMARVVGDNEPRDERARRVIVFDADPEELEARQANLGADVIIEPEILHRRLIDCPVELMGVNPIRAALGPGSANQVFPVVVTGDGSPVEGARVTLYAYAGRSFEGFTISTDKDGNAELGLPGGFVPSTLVVVPPGGFWSKVIRGPEAWPLNVELAPLPAAGPHGWWHRVVGAPARGSGRGIRVGVIDSGVGPHAALNHVTDAGAFIDAVHYPDGTDIDSHGTHVAGTIGGRPIRPWQYAGVAPDVDLHSVRVFQAGRDANQADIAEAIGRLSDDEEVDLINLSIGADQPSQIVEDAILDAADLGTLCVCAAGNASGSVMFPAAFSGAVAVSAFGRLGWSPADSLSALRLPTELSRFGEFSLFLANFSCFGNEITCGAPGVGIVAPVRERFGLQEPYAAMDGTSMACPIATAVLACLLSVDPAYRTLPRISVRAEHARSLLRNSCVDLGLDARFQGRGMPRMVP